MAIGEKIRQCRPTATKFCPIHIFGRLRSIAKNCLTPTQLKASVGRKSSSEKSILIVSNLARTIHKMRISCLCNNCTIV